MIIGFAMFERATRTIFQYDDPQGTPDPITARNINAHLVDAPNIFLEKQRSPICPVPEMAFGSMPNDGRHLLLSDEERADIINAEPASRKWIRPLMGSEEMINKRHAIALWLQEISPTELWSMPRVLSRVEKVRDQHLKSNREPTQGLANVPTLFGEIRQPTSDFLAIPEVS